MGPSKPFTSTVFACPPSTSRASYTVRCTAGLRESVYAAPRPPTPAPTMATRSGGADDMGSGVAGRVGTRVDAEAARAAEQNPMQNRRRAAPARPALPPAAAARAAA